MFESKAHQYIEPATVRDADAELVVTGVGHLAEYARSKLWQFEPRPANAQCELARVCIWHVGDDARSCLPPTVALDGYLRSLVLTGSPSAVGDDEEQRWWECLMRWSLPLDPSPTATCRRSSSSRHHRVRRRRTDPDPVSLDRIRAVVRGAFTAARKRRLLDRDPFDAVYALVLCDHDQIDPGLVMSSTDVITTAPSVRADRTVRYQVLRCSPKAV